MKSPKNRSDAEWFHTLESDVDYHIQAAKIDYAVNVERLMDKRSLSRVALAERLKKSAAYITKLLRGEQNLTIASMVRVARSLNCDLKIEMLERGKKLTWAIAQNHIQVIHGNAATPVRAANDSGISYEGVLLRKVS